MCINKVTVENWIEAKSELEAAKRKELELRTKIIKDFEERGINKLEGVVHNEYNGIDVAVSFKTTKTIDPAALDVIWGTLSDAEKSAISFKPSLNAAAYNKVKDSQSLANVITVKPAQASITFKILE